MLGLFASGILLEFFSWSSFFGLNVTLAVIGLVGTLLVVPRSRDAHPAPLDIAGSLLSLAARLVPRLRDHRGRGPWMDRPGDSRSGRCRGRHPDRLRRPAAAAALPLLDVGCSPLRGFGAGSVSVTVQFFAAFGFFYIVIQYLAVRGRAQPAGGRLHAAAPAVVLLPTARLAPRLAARVGTNRVGAAG